MKRDRAVMGRPLEPGSGAATRDAIAERVLALTFLAAFGVWMVLTFALGTT